MDEIWTSGLRRRTSVHLRVARFAVKWNSSGWAFSHDSENDLKHRLLYFNLHAFDGDPAWKSYDASADRFLDMVRPDAFSSTSIAGSVIISEAC